MADQSRDDRESTNKNRDEDYMKGGKGRKDEVGGSGIYPASDPNAPADAEIITEGELVAHRGAHPKPVNRKNEQKSDLSSGSEFLDADAE